MMRQTVTCISQDFIGVTSNTEQKLLASSAFCHRHKMIRFKELSLVHQGIKTCVWSNKLSVHKIKQSEFRRIKYMRCHIPSSMRQLSDSELVLSSYMNLTSVAPASSAFCNNSFGTAKPSEYSFSRLCNLLVRGSDCPKLSPNSKLSVSNILQNQASAVSSFHSQLT